MLLTEIVLLQRILQDGLLTMTMGQWLPPFGISFTVDVMGALLSLVSAFAVLICLLYSLQDVSRHESRFGFYPLMLVMLTGVTGSFMTGDLFNLYVWFEVMLISSFGLIVMGGTARQLDGAVKYGLLNFLATTLFLIATAYLYGLTGTLNMADLSRKVALIQDNVILVPVALLFVLAFGMKAAAFPVNFWLPASYHTPKPVVSAIFAGLLTKVGAYALVRTILTILPVTHSFLQDLLGIIAAATMIIAAFCALSETNLRRLCGFLVISGIGSILVGLAVGTEAALAGMTFYAIHSILVMTALYLLAGMIEKTCNALDTRQMGGLYQADPMLTILFFVVLLAAAGLPPMTGFWAKLLLVNATLYSGDYGLTFALLANAFLITIALGRIWVHVFLRGGALGTLDGTLDIKAHSIAGMPRVITFLPTSLLVITVIVIGVWPQLALELSLDAARSLKDTSAYIYSVFPGGNN